MVLKVVNTVVGVGMHLNLLICDGNCLIRVLATGSCDATARIWRFQEKGWTSITLEVTPQEMKK